MSMTTTAEELNTLLVKARQVLDRAVKGYHEALLTVARLEAQRDQMFLATGDKTILKHGK
jgi:hypothetical protein